MEPTERRPRPERAPVRYSRRLGERICQRLAAGEAWSRIAGKRGLPAHATLYRWRDRHPEFAEALKLAREAQAECWAERALAVAEASDAATLNSDKLRVSTLLWHAARAAPARYGDRAGREPEAGGPGRIIVEVRDFVPVTLADGRVVAREVLPDGRTADDDEP